MTTRHTNTLAQIRNRAGALKRRNPSESWEILWDKACSDLALLTNDPIYTQHFLPT